MRSKRSRQPKRIRLYENRQKVIRQAHKALADAESKQKYEDQAKTRIYIMYSAECGKCKGDMTLAEPNVASVYAQCSGCGYRNKLDKLRFDLYSMDAEKYNALQEERDALRRGDARDSADGGGQDVESVGTSGPGGRADSDDAGSAGVCDPETGTGG